MTYVAIEQDGTDPAVYTLNTPEEIESARVALREAGVESAPVYAGEPDGLGDSYRNGQTLFAAGIAVSAVEGIVRERGGGFPVAGAYVTDGNSLYRVVAFEGGIHTDGRGSGYGNYVFATVEEADWDDCAESDVHSAAFERGRAEGAEVSR